MQVDHLLPPDGHLYSSTKAVADAALNHCGNEKNTQKHLNISLPGTAKDGKLRDFAWHKPLESEGLLLTMQKITVEGQKHLPPSSKRPQEFTAARRIDNLRSSGTKGSSTEGSSMSLRTTPPFSSRISQPRFFMTGGYINWRSPCPQSFLPVPKVTKWFCS